MNHRSTIHNRVSIFQSSCTSNLLAKWSTVNSSNLPAFIISVFSAQATSLRALSLSSCGRQSSVVNWIGGRAIYIQVSTLPLTRCLILGKFLNFSKSLVLNQGIIIIIIIPKNKRIIPTLQSSFSDILRAQKSAWHLPPPPSTLLETVLLKTQLQCHISCSNHCSRRCLLLQFCMAAIHTMLRYHFIGMYTQIYIYIDDPSTQCHSSRRHIHHALFIFIPLLLSHLLGVSDTSLCIYSGQDKGTRKSSAVFIAIMKTVSIPDCLL